MGKPTLKIKRKPGRPSIFSQNLADKICARLAIGESARTVCADDGMPALASLFKWLRENKEFSEQYARAKQESADAMAEDILDISDEGSNDWMEKRYGRDAESTWVVNGEAVQRSKLRVETRKWLMAKMKPKRYADHIDVTSDGKAIETNTIILKKFDGTETDSKQ